MCVCLCVCACLCPFVRIHVLLLVHMRRMSASTMIVVEEDEDSVISDETIWVRKSPPKACKCLSIPLYFVATYIYVIMFSGLHAFTIMEIMLKVNKGWMMAVFFGLLGPISVIHWIFSFAFVATGTVALFSKNRDYMQSAISFRRWTRVTRFYLVSLVAATVQFLYGCYMFSEALSLNRTLKWRMRYSLNETSRVLFHQSYTHFSDQLAYSNANAVLPYPLNLVFALARNWPTSIIFLFIIPWPWIFYASTLQQKYFNWRFHSAKLQID